MMNDTRFLRAPTIFSRLHEEGRRNVVYVQDLADNWLGQGAVRVDLPKDRNWHNAPEFRNFDAFYYATMAAAL